MSNNLFLRTLAARWLVLPAATLFSISVSTTASNSLADDARLDGVTQADGTNSFALSLKASSTSFPGPAAAGPREVVILVSTAASESGDYRQQSLAAVQSTISHLDPNDRVKLMAFDLRAVALTPGFVAPNSPEMKAAISSLEGRVPLGSCDMAEALTAAVKSYSGDSKAARAIVYVGDGSSRANVLASDQVAKLMQSLTDEHIPVLSYGVGPRVDERALDALAAHTGGIALFDRHVEAGGDFGSILATAAHGSVLWPNGAAKWPEGMDVYPKTFPPLRSDRDTVVVGTTKNKTPQKVDLSFDGPSGPQKLAVNIPEFKSDDSNGYISSLVDQAKVDNGMTLPVVDTASLRDAKREIATGGRTIDDLARQALNSGNTDGANQLADEALRRNPNDAAARAIKSAATKAPASGGTGVPLAGAPAAPPPPAASGDPAAVGGGNDLDLSGPLQGAPVAGGPENGALAGAVAGQSAAMEEALQKEVQNVINQARNIMSTNPEGAQQQVQVEVEHIKPMDVRSEVKDKLVNMLHVAMREAKTQQKNVEMARQARIEAENEAREREAQLQELRGSQVKMKQLMERFDSLMLDGKQRIAEDQSASEVQKLSQQVLESAKPMAAAAMLTSRLSGNLDRSLEVRVMAQKGFADAIYQTDKSHVPYPDEPPIVYPDADVWRELTKRRKDRYSSTDLAKKGTKDKAIEEALKSPTQIEFVDTPLKEVVDYLKDYHKIEIQLDLAALKDAGVEPDVPVSKSLKGISLRSALHLLLDDLQLKYVIHNEVLLITSPSKAESDEFMTTKVYPVADLVLPIRDIQPPSIGGGMGGGMGGGGGGMMGGMGGGGGGMMGGMGGGGMGGGGMGGGGGGFGGGMGGGGMGGGGGFPSIPCESIPCDVVPSQVITRQILPQPVAQPVGHSSGLKAYAVKPESLSTSGESVPSQSVSSQSVPTAASMSDVLAKAVKTVPQVIQLQVDPGKAAGTWETYFAQRDELSKRHQKNLMPSDGDIVKTVLALREEKKFDQIEGLIEAALRHGQCHPWMFEILAISIKAQGRPDQDQDVERALMSAADFVQNTADLMYLGVFLEQEGYDRRALQIFQQVSKVEPLWPEPYMHGMKLAKKLDNDLDGLQWSTVGILSQAWPTDQAVVEESANRVAQATLASLRKTGRNAEADTFQKNLDAANQRDCAVRVQWTGDADVDVMIQEPADTVCSLRNSRTSSGGILIGDIAGADGNALDGHSVVYTCPKAFSGNYQVLIRRVWGKLTADKVTVSVATHSGTPQSRSYTYQPDMHDGEFLIKFDLADGRRTDPLRDRMVANAAVAQVNLHRQILAQQLAATNDPNANAALAAQQNAVNAANQASFQSAANNANNPFPVAFPVPLRSAVGYSPIIITLPEGTNYAATAVVSADRRYVRITCVPFFSAVSQVHTFSISSGATQNTGGGTGGQGFSGGGNGFGAVGGGGNGANPGGGAGGVGGAGGGAGGGAAGGGIGVGAGNGGGIN